ncbi:MAG: hypothetical protein J6Y99_07485 [Bacteroidales bacterium]|nr:hypothetical protein [Bacteroidales bacterium]
MSFTIFLALDPYLAQWLTHESGGSPLIQIKRNSAEADILELYLKPQPKAPGYVPQLRPLEGEVTIELPWFKYKDIRTYNYLDERGKQLLKHCIRNRFLVQLWRDLMTVRNVVRRTDETIIEWMDRHGIEYDERNWNAIAKILQRKRAIYGPLKKSSPNQQPTSIHFCPRCESHSPESNQ